MIDDFMAAYEREHDFYHRVAAIVKDRCEVELAKVGVRAIVSFRAKSAQSLKLKLEKKQQESGDSAYYTSIQDIREQIKDLAGVRIALYFPSEMDEVSLMIDKNFVDVGERKSFPEDSVKQLSQYKRTFSGYRANHYLVRIPEQELSPSDKKYGNCSVEIQVASVLMHAWSEVEHDLIYKTPTGHPAQEEELILDQINGLVLAGELALRNLYTAHTIRVSRQPFESHYELAYYVASQLGYHGSNAFHSASTGRIDLLLEFLKSVNMNNPSSIETYVQNVGDEAIKSSVAEEIGRLIVAINPHFSSSYQQHFAIPNAVVSFVDSEKNSWSKLDMRFLDAWNSIESELSRIGSIGPTLSRRSMAAVRRLSEQGLIDEATVRTIQHGRKTRNHIVHNEFRPEDETLQGLTSALEGVLSTLRKVEPSQTFDIALPEKPKFVEDS